MAHLIKITLHTEPSDGSTQGSLRMASDAPSLASRRLMGSVGDVYDSAMAESFSAQGNRREDVGLADILKRRHPNVVAVALANNIAL